MGDEWRKKKNRMLVLATLSVSVCSFEVFASGNTGLPPVTPEDIISIDLPVLTEEGRPFEFFLDPEGQPFDFFLDPEGLLYETDAMIYGGGIVEAGATLLFHNSDGDYDFSRHSDYLNIKNKSTFPVSVTITARITDLGEIELKETDDFLDSESASMYLALTDSEGNIQPLSAEREVSINVQMLPASETLTDSEGNIQPFSAEGEVPITNQTLPSSETISFDHLDENYQTFRDDLTESVYSFGLTGACNPKADWLNVEVHPVVTVTWFAEPIQQEMLAGEDSVDVQGEDVSVSDSTEGDKDDRITESERITDHEGDNNATLNDTTGYVSDGDAKSQNTVSQEDKNAAEPDRGADQEGDDTTEPDSETEHEDDNVTEPDSKVGSEDDDATKPNSEVGSEDDDITESDNTLGYGDDVS